MTKYEKNIDKWYKNLKKSPLTPPDYVFGIVWPILYLLLLIYFLLGLKEQNINSFNLFYDSNDFEYIMDNSIFQEKTNKFSYVYVNRDIIFHYIIRYRNV